MVARLADQLWSPHRRTVDADLVCARKQQLPEIFHASHAAAHRERHHHGLGHLGRHVQHQLAALMGGGDVVKHQLVGLLLLVGAGQRQRVSGVAVVLEEPHVFDDPAILNVQTRNDALGQHLSSLAGT